MINNFAFIPTKHFTALDLYEFFAVCLFIIFQLSLPLHGWKKEGQISAIAIQKGFIKPQMALLPQRFQLPAPSSFFNEILVGHSRFEAASIRLSDEPNRDSLQTQLNEAALVVSGKVVLSGLVDTYARERISEHDALLRGAVIEIRQILKGKKTTKTLTVYYASSDDVAWQQSPKLKKGQEAIFLLKADASSPVLNVLRYILLNYFDIKKLATIRRIHQLLKTAH